MMDNPREKKHRTDKKTHGPVRTWLRFIIWTVLLIGLMALFFTLVLHIPWVQNQIINRAVDRLETITGINIEIERFEWRPFSYLRLLHLEVETFGEKFLQCDQADLNYHLSWNSPYFHPVELFLQKPLLRLEKDEQGHWKFPKKGRESVSGPPKENPFLLFPSWAQVPLPRLRLSSATILAYQNGQTILSIKDVDGTLSFRVVPGPKGPLLKIDLGIWEGQPISRH
jgi:hypothetical protein